MRRISKIEAVDKQGNKFIVDCIFAYKVNDKSFVLFDKNNLLKTLYNENVSSMPEDKQSIDSVKVYPMLFDDETNSSQLKPLAEDEKEIAKYIIDKYNERQMLNSLLIKMNLSMDTKPAVFELDYDINVSDFTLTIFIEDEAERAKEIDNIVSQIDDKISDLERQEYQELKGRLIDKNEDVLSEIVVFLYSINIYKLWMIDEIRELKQNRFINDRLTLLLDVLSLLVKLSLDIDFDKELLKQNVYSIFQLDIDSKISKCILSKLIEKKDVHYVVPVIYSNKEYFKEYLDELEKIADILYENADCQNAMGIYLIILESAKNYKKDKLSALYNSLGCCYVDVKKYDDAVKAFEKSIQLNKKNAAAYNNLAYTYSENANLITPYTELWKSKMQSAITNIQVAMAIRDDVIYYNNHMHIEYDFGNYENVLNIWNSVAEFNFKYDEMEGMYFLYVLANLELFEIKKEEKFLKEAIGKLNIMYENNPSGLRMYRFIFDSIAQRKLPKDKIDNIVRIAFLTSKIKSNLEIPNDVKQVAYYTTLQNFQYILNDERDKEKYRIPVFDANHMNDPNEGVLLYKFLEKHVKHFNNAIKPREMYSRYVCSEEFVFLKSFSLNIDSLPMWVHYGNGGQGCCVVVNSDTFINSDTINNREEKAYETKTPKDDYSLYRVVYFDGRSIDQDEYPELQPLLNSLIQALAELFEHNSGDSITAQLVKIANYYLSRIKYLFKHNDYAYEKEVRIILHRNTEESLKDVKATDTSFPKLYVYLKNQIQLDEIILGPKVNEANNYIPFISLKLHDMKNTNCIISKSSIDFR